MPKAIVGSLSAIECEAPEDELLFADWLNALVYEMATRKMLFSRFVVQLEGTQLESEAWGERIDPARHHPAVEVKGAWRGRQVVDELAARGILIMSPSMRGIAEEAPNAYKDVAAVVDAADAAGLARKVARLEPLICIKG